MYIHKLKNIIQSLKKLSSLIWTSILLIYSISMFTFLVLGISAVPVVFILSFYIFVPGYALTSAVLNRLDKLEEAILSIGMSLALFTGIRGLMQMFGLRSFISENIILSILSMISFTIKLFLKRKQFQLFQMA